MCRIYYLPGRQYRRACCRVIGKDANGERFKFKGWKCWFLPGHDPLAQPDKNGKLPKHLKPEHLEHQVSTQAQLPGTFERRQELRRASDRALLITLLLVLKGVHDALRH